MVVNSLKFFVFFCIFLAVWFLPLGKKRTKLQNIWLLIGCYVFYGVADWRTLPLLACATLAFYGIGLWIQYEKNKDNESAASNISIIGVVLAIGLLLYFKYLNFFADSFAQLLSAIGLNVTWTTMHIVMPIGVSFFTFKLISYVLEVKNEHIEPCHDIVEFANYVAFFPTILSGPIDRPNKFLPQLRVEHHYDAENVTRGLQQILWGIFKKMVIADNLMPVVESSWSISSMSGSTFLLAMLLYPIQMYADFSGYSDMAIGVGRVMGFKVAKNFNYPFFSRNIAEFWRGWHISLTQWLTDYVFMPLNFRFRDLGKLGMVMAILINMILVGFWHGAYWTYGLYGLYHGLLFIPLILSGAFFSAKKMKTNKFDLPYLGDFLKMSLTYLLVSIGLIIFRAETIEGVFSYFGNVLQPSLFSLPKFIGQDNSSFLVAVPFIIVLLVADWRNRKKECPIYFEYSHGWKAILCYSLLVASIFFIGAESSSFIYFKF